MGAKADEDPGFLDKLRATPTGRLALKIGIGALGSLVIALGIILIPFPGPGWAIVILGLAIWALEFAWAKSLLQFTRRNVKAWTTWIGRRGVPIRGVLGVVGLGFVAGVVWASVRVSFGVDLIDKAREWLS
ncbi:PGPGW domain-containing protein [Actinoplanes subtropicus]|uniref:PGPGW domain-containing protein n=1 Tax=Actinoplanes subtropicus TaxID=543632 RepID=UPI0004C358E3|nr:PGPGW domain-containing protein [Actinoplanes subtropicus]